MVIRLGRKRVFDANKELRGSTHEMGVPLIDIIADEIRSLGEGLIISDQEPSKLTSSIKANTYIKIVGYLGHGKDIQDISEALALNESYRKMLSRLRKGLWLVK